MIKSLTTKEKRETETVLTSSRETRKKCRASRRPPCVQCGCESQKQSPTYFTTTTEAARSNIHTNKYYRRTLYCTIQFKHEQQTRLFKHVIRTISVQRNGIPGTRRPRSTETKFNGTPAPRPGQISHTNQYMDWHLIPDSVFWLPIPDSMFWLPIPDINNCFTSQLIQHKLR